MVSGIQPSIIKDDSASRIRQTAYGWLIGEAEVRDEAFKKNTYRNDSKEACTIRKVSADRRAKP